MLIGLICSPFIQKSFPIPVKHWESTLHLMVAAEWLLVLLIVGMHRIYNFKFVGRFSGCDWCKGPGVVSGPDHKGRAKEDQVSLQRPR